jgi:hypothetical protein
VRLQQLEETRAIPRVCECEAQGSVCLPWDASHLPGPLCSISPGTQEAEPLVWIAGKGWVDEGVAGRSKAGVCWLPAVCRLDWLGPHGVSESLELVVNI